MSDLEKAAKEMLLCVDRMLRDGEWYAAQEKADALRAALAKQTEPVAWQDTSNPKELVAAEDWENIDPAWHWMYRPLYAVPKQAAAIRAGGGE